MKKKTYEVVIPRIKFELKEKRFIASTKDKYITVQIDKNYFFICQESHKTQRSSLRRFAPWNASAAVVQYFIPNGINRYQKKALAHKLRLIVMKKLMRLLYNHFNSELEAKAFMKLFVNRRLLGYYPDKEAWDSIKEIPYALNDICHYRIAKIIFGRYDFPIRKDWQWKNGINHINKAKMRLLLNAPRSLSDDCLNKLMENLSVNHSNLNRTQLVVLSELIPQHHHTVINSPKKDLLEAFHQWKFDHNTRWRKAYKTHDLIQFARYLSDYPDEYHGNSIINFYNRVKQWHDEQPRRNYFQQNKIDPDTPVTYPVCGLPDAEGINFLNTAGSIYDESDKMKHCVRSYVSKAVKGECFLFHVEHEGEHATVEVSPTGEIRQSYGPCNQTNKASEWARDVLTKWGEQLPQTKFIRRSARFNIDINQYQAEYLVQGV